MNNSAVDTMLLECREELSRVEHLIIGLGTSPVINYLIKYSVIRACGTIEQSYKTLIADYYESFSSVLIQFITKHVRENSKNPSYQAIKNQIQEFDDIKAETYSTLINSLTDKNRIIASLESLRALRNDVAHGNSISCSIADIIVYFDDSKVLIEQLDAIMI